MDISIKKLIRHFSHYTPLIGILVFAIFGFYLFPYDKSFQMIIGIAAASGYVSWGLVSHHIHGDLNISIIVEYLAIAATGIVILFIALF